MGGRGPDSSRFSSQSKGSSWGKPDSPEKTAGTFHLEKRTTYRQVFESTPEKNMQDETSILIGEGSSLPGDTRRKGSGYDKVASDHTIRPLSREQLAQVLTAARSFVPPPGWFEGVTPWQVVEFLELTGVAPMVLCKAATKNLRSAPDLVDGRLHVRFTRHKKSGLAGEQDLPVVTLEDPAAQWIPPLIRRFHNHPWTTMHLYRLVSMVGQAAGIPLSARILRHTCGVRIAAAGDMALVCDWLNCSVATAVDYLRLARAHDPRFLALARGSPARPPGVPSSPGAA